MAPKKQTHTQVCAEGIWRRRRRQEQQQQQTEETQILDSIFHGEEKKATCTNGHQILIFCTPTINAEAGKAGLELKYSSDYPEGIELFHISSWEEIPTLSANQKGKLDVKGVWTLTASGGEHFFIQGLWTLWLVHLHKISVDTSGSKGKQ